LVARMERSEIRDFHGRETPDYAEFTLGRTEGATRGLHPGYLLGPIHCVVGAPAQENHPCPTLFDCTACSQPSPIRFIAPSSRRTPWRSGCRPTALPAPCIISMRKSAALSRCRFAISPPA